MLVLLSFDGYVVGMIKASNGIGSDKNSCVFEDDSLCLTKRSLNLIRRGPDSASSGVIDVHGWEDSYGGVDPHHDASFDHGVAFGHHVGSREVPDVLLQL